MLQWRMSRRMMRWLESFFRFIVGDCFGYLCGLYFGVVFRSRLSFSVTIRGKCVRCHNVRVWRKLSDRTSFFGQLRATKPVDVGQMMAHSRVYSTYKTSKTLVALAFGTKCREPTRDIEDRDAMDRATFPNAHPNIPKVLTILNQQSQLYQQTQPHITEVGTRRL